MSLEFKSENTIELLSALDNALLKAQDEIRSKSKAMSELVTLASHNEELESEIESAKGKIFGLLYEKLRLAELACIDDYEALIDKEVQAVAPQAPAQKEKK